MKMVAPAHIIRAVNMKRFSTIAAVAFALAALAQLLRQRRSGLLLSWSALLAMAYSGSTIAQQPAQHAAPKQAVAMSSGLHQLFLSEMHELAGGVQAVAAAIPAGEWSVVVRSAEAMRDSYVLNKKLTKAQEQELEALPQAFKALDASFHSSAQNLARAGVAKDRQLASFYFSRLIETCAACHASFASARFPGLSSIQEASHHP